MAWIELHDTLSNHKKTYALADRLKIKQYAAIGILVSLWTWALNNSHDGDLSGLPDTAIAHACFWDKNPSDFVSALKDTGWLDDDGCIHDWYEYAGRLLDKREQNAERKRKSRACRATVTRDVRVTDNDRHRATVPNRTKHNQTVPNHTVVDEDGARANDGGGFLTDAEAQSLADGIHSVLDAAKRAGFPDTQADWDKCNVLVSVYGANAVISAIGICADRPLDKRNYGYLRGVLEKDPGGGKLPGKQPDKGKGYYNPFPDLARKYEEEGT